MLADTRRSQKKRYDLFNRYLPRLALSLILHVYVHPRHGTNQPQAWDAGHAALLTALQRVVNDTLGERGLVVAINADRPDVLGRNFEVLSPGPNEYDVDDDPSLPDIPGNAIEAVAHEERVGRVALIRGGYYAAPGSTGWDKGYANCLPPPIDGSRWYVAAALSNHRWCCCCSLCWR
jgi:hypothetical protein